MVFEKIKKIILDELDVPEEKVTMDANLVDDLGADSLDAIELVMEIEEEFSIEVKNEDFDSIKTIGDMVKYVEELIK